jgi:hypothetical protein
MRAEAIRALLDANPDLSASLESVVAGGQRFFSGGWTFSHEADHGLVVCTSKSEATRKVFLDYSEITALVMNSPSVPAGSAGDPSFSAPQTTTRMHYVTAALVAASPTKYSGYSVGMVAKTVSYKTGSAAGAPCSATYFYYTGDEADNPEKSPTHIVQARETISPDDLPPE